MKIYGLLGHPLSHSFSKRFFTKKFAEEQIADCQYLNFSFPEIEHAVAELKALIDLQGFNITIPFKEKILPFLDNASDAVQSIHSCNCIKKVNGKWYGFNTDITGFESSLRPLLRPNHKQALVFGTGGASKAVTYVLNKLEIEFSLVSRTGSGGRLSYMDLTPEIISNHHLLINTTPVGQFPKADEKVAIPYEGITRMHLAYDLLYNPEETMFLKEALDRGAVTKNGLEMLKIQAEESWAIWNSK